MKEGWQRGEDNSVAWMGGWPKLLVSPRECLLLVPRGFGRNSLQRPNVADLPAVGSVMFGVPEERIEMVYT